MAFNLNAVDAKFNPRCLWQFSSPSFLTSFSVYFELEVPYAYKMNKKMNLNFENRSKIE